MEGILPPNEIKKEHIEDVAEYILFEVNEPFAVSDEPIRDEIFECILSSCIKTEPSVADSSDLPSSPAISVGVKSELLDVEGLSRRLDIIPLASEHSNVPDFSDAVLKLLEYIPVSKDHFINFQKNLIDLRRLQVRIANLKVEALGEVAPVLQPLEDFLKLNSSHLSFIAKHFTSIQKILDCISVDSFERFQALNFESSEAKIGHPLVNVILNLLKMTNNPSISLQIQLGQNSYLAQFDSASNVSLIKESSDDATDLTSNVDEISENCFIASKEEAKSNTNFTSIESTPVKNPCPTRASPLKKQDSANSCTKSKNSMMKVTRNRTLLTSDEEFSNKAEPQRKKRRLNSVVSSEDKLFSDQELIQKEKMKLEREKQLLLLKLKAYEEKELEIEKMKQELEMKMKVVQQKESIVCAGSTQSMVVETLSDKRNDSSTIGFNSSLSGDTVSNTDKNPMSCKESNPRRISPLIDMIHSKNPRNVRRAEPYRKKSLRYFRKVSADDESVQKNIIKIRKENILAVAKSFAAKQLLRYDGPPENENLKVCDHFPRIRYLTETLDALAESVPPSICVSDNERKSDAVAKVKTSDHKTYKKQTEAKNASSVAKENNLSPQAQSLNTSRPTEAKNVFAKVATKIMSPRAEARNSSSQTEEKIPQAIAKNLSPKVVAKFVSSQAEDKKMSSSAVANTKGPHKETKNNCPQSKAYRLTVAREDSFSKIVHKTKADVGAIDLINDDCIQKTEFQNPKMKRHIKGKRNCLQFRTSSRLAQMTALNKSVTKELSSTKKGKSISKSLPFDPSLCQFDVFDPITCCVQQGKVPNYSHSDYLKAPMEVVSHKLLISDFMTASGKVQTIPCLVALCLDIYIYVCPRCRFQTNCRFRFRLHCYTHSYTTYKCSQCNFKSNSKLKVKEHELKHLYSVLSLKCDRCNFIVFDEKGLLKHKMQHSVPSETEPKCFQCDFVGENFLQVRIHYIYVHGLSTLNMRIECEICATMGNNFFNFDDLGEHMKAHMTSDGKLFMCNRCEFTTEKLHMLDQHSRAAHRKTKGFDCDVSLYKTNDIVQFARHKEEECKTPQLSCKLCNFEASNLQALSRHKKAKHTNLKCRQCDFVTNSADEFANHKKCHSVKVKPKTVCFMPLTCDICGFDSVNRVLMTRHLLLSHNMQGSAMIDALERMIQASGSNNDVHKSV